MKRATVVVCLGVSVGLAWLARPSDRTERARAAGTEQPPVGPVLLLPGVKESSRLRLDVVLDGKPPTAAWDAFLRIEVRPAGNCHQFSLRGNRRSMHAAPTPCRCTCRLSA
jgi:hypothetical protein